MIRFLADEDLDGRIIRGLIRRLPELDVVRVQDVGLRTAHDRDVLEFAAAENRVLLTHDVTTMANFALERVANGLPMPGIFEIPQSVAIGVAIEDLLVIAQYSLEDEWHGQIRFLPLR